MRDHENGVKHASIAVEKNPDSFHSHINYGFLLLKNNQIPEAIFQLQKAKKTNPTYGKTRIHLGRAYSTNKKYEDADLEFSEASKLNLTKYDAEKCKWWHTKNFVTWVRSMRQQSKFNASEKFLSKALEFIKWLLKADPRNFYYINLYRQISLDLAITNANLKDKDKGDYYFSNAVEEYRSGIRISAKRSFVAKAYFYYAIPLHNNKLISADDTIDLLQSAHDNAVDVDYRKRISSAIKRLQANPRAKLIRMN